MAEAPVPAPAPGGLGRGYLGFLFSGNNLTQASTIQAALHFVSATGLVVMSPDEQQQAADGIVHLIGATMEWIAAMQYVISLAKFLYNERKHTIVNAISTTAPVVVTGGATVETKHG